MLYAENSTTYCDNCQQRASIGIDVAHPTVNSTPDQLIKDPTRDPYAVHMPIYINCKRCGPRHVTDLCSANIYTMPDFVHSDELGKL